MLCGKLSFDRGRGRGWAFDLIDTSTQPMSSNYVDEENGFPAACAELLAEQPRTKVLGIEAVAGNAYLYELRPERTPIGAVAPEDIVSAIRTAAAESWVS